MIRKQDILDRAAEWRLRPDVVEKDYVLGWLLAGIAKHPEASVSWVFKGGTCLKKCYFETYRFSEDLDFSLLPNATYTEAGLRKILAEVTQLAHDMGGVDFPADVVAVRERKDKQGRPTFEGKVGYLGPLAIHTVPRILFDITQHEAVLEQGHTRPVSHAYPDQGDLAQVRVAAYSLAELFAEKTRALYERSRPRDLYDVIFILSNRADAIDLPLTRDLFQRKCRGKGFAPPSAADVLAKVQGSDDLRSEWSNMLAHQLPELPPIETMLERLPPLLAWINAPVAIPALPRSPLGKGERVLAPVGATYWNVGAPLEVVRFAGANRLLVAFDYHGKPRLVEPYSLRMPSTGNLLLYAWETADAKTKAFKVAELENVRVTNRPFSPKFMVEFTSAGMLGG